MKDNYFQKQLSTYKGEINMAASSVTGVGNGSADGSNKGSERMTLGVTHLIGPRIQAAGTVVLAAGVATITFPQPLSGSEANYVVMLTPETAAGAAHEVSVSAKTDDADGNFASFAIAGAGAADSVMWAVINV